MMNPAETGGAIADALTVLRIAVTPVIMVLILWRWPDVQAAILASFLFIIAALTDVFDDLFGGRSDSHLRRFGFLDDIADTVLMVGCLLALSAVLWRENVLGWAFAVPVAVLISREVIVGLVKGGELRRTGWPDNFLSNAKGGFAMLGVALLVASPWLTQWVDMTRATPETIVAIYDNASPVVWIIGQFSLWIAALFSVLSGIKILRHNGSDASS